MKISELQLNRIYFQVTFDTLYELKDDVPIILNSLQIYTIVRDWINEKVDFDIFTDKNGKRYINPRYNPSHCDRFLLTGERLAMCKKIEIKADDYIDVIKNNGNFTFTLENN